jgi:DNA-binding NarL/FixJ family response regulator
MKEVKTMSDTFIFRKEWIDNISMLDQEVQDQIISDLARYGVGLPLLHTKNPVVASIVETQKKRIDASTAAYEEKVVMSQNAGRKSKIDRIKIYELARAGLSAKEIALELGCSQSTVQHSEEWKQARKDMNGSENSVENSTPKSVFDF